MRLKFRQLAEKTRRPQKTHLRLSWCRSVGSARKGARILEIAGPYAISSNLEPFWRRRWIAGISHVGTRAVQKWEFPFVYNACGGISEPLEEEEPLILAGIMRVPEIVFPTMH
ncbi:MAG TPA: hypothetical protein DCS07_00065 [Bdellovibrionales bacterium]|nr:MAG: hypothetical protein A2Z97_01020 [Bdellovibrionales bacterium GWB1_52_6]OFZ03106.1 MAG: hypothetical protein A2X97_09720 [Bdellovibrionales bacterium GWA1_52_35]OFZ41323.1 MAG: hypothetical protein A2070_09035 [Bdellovibrionales bacterium GWC1_52_8]HAR41027.1 hypothetical protein [Bdellovibrionales bacterium]HCM40434.1 hypothetical protein [Bdellovibrionales bacterium]